MEPKDNLHSDPQKEVKDSGNNQESIEKKDEKAVEKEQETKSSEKEAKEDNAVAPTSEKETEVDETAKAKPKAGDSKKSASKKTTEKSEPKVEEKDEAEISEPVKEKKAKASSKKPKEVADSEEVKKEEKAEAEEEPEEEKSTVSEKAESVKEEKPEKENEADSEVVAQKEEETEETEKEPAEKVDEAKTEKESEVAEKVDSEAADKKEDVAEENKPEVAKDTADEAVENKSEEKAVEEVDYSKYTEVELINAFRDLLENGEFTDIQRKIENIKLNFYKKHKIKIQEQKKAFLDKGGFEEDFKPEENPYEQDLKNLLNEYKNKKTQYNKLLEAEKDENLKLKYQVIEEIKNLVNSKESINKTFQEFKELQQRWRDIGLVPQSSLKNLWETYHHHVENFYDYIKINKELRDLDLKKNMEEKIVLCEKAEALLLEPSVIKAFNALQKLHDTWREIGPVPREKKEELWERFKDATTKINKKHQEFFESRKATQKKNLETKSALCEKVEEILALDLKNHKEWEEKSKEIIEIQKYWRTIGFAPKKDNNSIYERFRNACDTFFDNKRAFYSKHKEIQANNLQLKIDLCVQAEALKDSTDWKKTTQEFIDIQKKWKEIGPVPRKHSDSVWKRFRTACDYFFDKKSDFFDNIDEKQVENLKLKNELVNDVAGFKPTGKDEEDFEQLKNFQRRWTEIGHVPFKKKDDVQKRYRDAINSQFDKLKVDDRDRNLLKFRNKVTGLKNTSRGQNKMYAERDKYVSKLKTIENDLITLQNNIGFFSNSKNAEALIKDVKLKIKNNEEQIAYLKDKIRIIDDMDREND